MDPLKQQLLETVATVEPTQAFWGALFSVGASLIGGLLSKPKAPTPAPAPQVVKVVETRNEVDYKKLAENAREGGFNPKTALQYGGAAGHAVTQTPFLTSNPDYVNWQAQNEYEQRRSSWLGGMFSSVGSAIGQVANYQQAQRTNYWNEQLVKSEINRNYAVSNNFRPSVNYPSNSEYFHASNDGPQSFSDIMQHDWEQPKYTQSAPWYEMTTGIMRPHPWLLDAETVDNMWGDWAGSGYGLLKAPIDLTYTGTKVITDASRKYLGPHIQAGIDILYNNINRNAFGSWDNFNPGLKTTRSYSGQMKRHAQ